MYKRLFLPLSVLFFTSVFVDIVAGKTFSSLNPYLNGEVRFVTQTLRSLENPIVFDIGANKGSWTRIARKANPHSTVYAFEPGPYAFNILNKGFINHKDIHCFPIGLSSRDQSNVTFYSYEDVIPKGNTLNSLYSHDNLDQEYGNPTKTVITLTTLDAFCKSHSIDHIDLLKIDTEGEEYNILQGAVDLLDNGCIDNIQFEYGYTYKAAGRTLEEVYHFLTSRGFKIYYLTYRGKEYLQNWDPAHENYMYSNYGAIREE